jgi:hypothetical protein
MEPKALFDQKVAQIESLIQANPELHTKRLRSGAYTAYAIHETTGRICFLRASYRHTVRPEFTTVIIDRDKNHLWATEGHPRRNHVTVKNGWTIDPDYRADW